MTYDKRLLVPVNDSILAGLDRLAKKAKKSRSALVRELALDAINNDVIKEDYEVVSEGSLPHPPDAEAVKVVFVRRKES